VSDIYVSNFISASVHLRNTLVYSKTLHLVTEKGGKIIAANEQNVTILSG